MAKPEWGVKRTCLACATRFYDMCKNPILCPSCGVKFDVETIFRPRRSRAPVDEPAAATAAKPAVPAAEEDDGDDLEKELAALADDSVDDDDDDDDAAIEDTSDLADDDSDVPIVPKDINDESN